MTSMEFETRLTHSKIAFGAINSAGDLRGHKAFRAAEYGSADGQVVTMPAPPVKWTVPHGKDGRRTPGIGEHTEAAECEFLG